MNKKWTQYATAHAKKRNQKKKNLHFRFCTYLYNLFSRDLRCLRNTIHANLFLTYILAALLWLSITLIYQVSYYYSLLLPLPPSSPSSLSLPSILWQWPRRDVAGPKFVGRLTHFPIECNVDDPTITLGHIAPRHLNLFDVFTLQLLDCIVIYVRVHDSAMSVHGRYLRVYRHKTIINFTNETNLCRPKVYPAVSDVTDAVVDFKMQIISM